MTESRPHIAHPWAIAVIVYWVVLAAALMIGPLIGWYPVLSLAGVAPWLSAAVGLTLAAGSGLVLSALGRHRYRSTRWGQEMTGLILAGGAWLTYGSVAITIAPLALSGWGQAAAFAAGCVLRIREVLIIERRTREAADRLGDR